MTIALQVETETYPIAGTFTISRGSRTEISVVTVHLTRDGVTGRAECVPYPRYGESVEGVADTIRRFAPHLSKDPTCRSLLDLMPAGAARNAVDCALWDLEAKRTGIRAWQTFGLDAMRPMTTAYTLSLGTPQEMEKAAAAAASRALLKIKLGGDGDEERIDAVRRGAPDSDLIVDANEAWRDHLLDRLLAAAHRAGVKLVEQPLPAEDDEALRDCSHAVPICADESAHTADRIESLVGKYDAINIKLDKTGGLTEAQTLANAARDHGFQIMVGCMVGTSLGMAPATLIAQQADFVDLDGPLLLARDREPGLKYEGSMVYPPEALLWG